MKKYLFSRMRIVCILGALVSAAGFFFSTFVYDVWLLMILFGIVAGTGLGLMYVPAVCSVGYYFDKKRAFATGFVCSGSGAGTFILAPFASFLLIQVIILILLSYSMQYIPSYR